MHPLTHAVPTSYKLERLVATLSQMEGEGHLTVSFDLTDFDRLKHKVKEIVSEVGPVDGLVNCAGVSTTLPLKLMDAKKMDEFFHTNVFSAIELTRHFCQMGNVRKEGACIIFMSSIMGIVGDNGKSLYSMTKGALLSAVRSLACEYARRKIRFNAISPGAILTPINQDLPHMKNLEMRIVLEDKHLLRQFGITKLHKKLVIRDIFCTFIGDFQLLIKLNKRIDS